MTGSLPPGLQTVLADRYSQWAPRSDLAIRLRWQGTLALVLLVGLGVPVAQYFLLDATITGRLSELLGNQSLCIPIVLAAFVLGTLAIAWCVKTLVSQKPFDLARAHDIAALHREGKLMLFSHYQRSLIAVGRDASVVLCDDLKRIENLHRIANQFELTQQTEATHEPEAASSIDTEEKVLA